MHTAGGLIDVTDESSDILFSHFHCKLNCLPCLPNSSILAKRHLKHWFDFFCWDFFFCHHLQAMFRQGLSWCMTFRVLFRDIHRLWPVRLCSYSHVSSHTHTDFLLLSPLLSGTFIHEGNLFLLQKSQQGEWTRAITKEMKVQAPDDWANALQHIRSTGELRGRDPCPRVLHDGISALVTFFHCTGALKEPKCNWEWSPHCPFHKSGSHIGRKQLIHTYAIVFFFALHLCSRCSDTRYILVCKSWAEKLPWTS